MRYEPPCPRSSGSQEADKARLRDVREVVHSHQNSQVLLERLPAAREVPERKEAVNVRVWLAVTDDMPEFCEWFGRTVAARLARLEKAQKSQRYYHLAQLFKPAGGSFGGNKERV
jgi:hypothetical protein